MSDIVGVSEDSDLGESESGFEGSRKLRDGGQRYPARRGPGRDHMQKHSRAK